MCMHLSTIISPRNQITVAVVGHSRCHWLPLHAGRNGYCTTHGGNTSKCFPTKAEPLASYLFQIVEVPDLASAVATAGKGSILTGNAVAVIFDLKRVDGISSNVDEYTLRSCIEGIINQLFDDRAWVSEQLVRAYLAYCYRR